MNTKFFHALVEMKRRKSRIFRIQNKIGEWLTDQAYIANARVAFYHNQFISTQTEYNFHLVPDLIPKLIDNGQNLMLTASPTMEEIRNDVAAMNPDGASGLDGFGGIFYVKCRDGRLYIKQDLIKAVHSFLQGTPLPKSWTSTLIVILPKVSSPKNFRDMKHISL